MNKKFLIGILVIGGIAIGGWKLIPEAYERKQAENTLTLYGNVDIRDVSLSFRVPGRIHEMRFEEGDRITKGTVIATLDKDTFQEDLNTANAELAEAQAALKNAERTYNRQARLVKTKIVSEALYDEAVANRDQSSARVDTAMARIEKLVTSLEDTEIHAPADGMILTRVREPGAIVQVGQPVYTLALDAPVWIRTYVDEPNLGHIYPGQKATVMTDSGNNYTGQIGFISPQAEFTPKNVETTQLRTDLVYRLRVIVDQPDQNLRQGMPVTVHIDTSRGANAQ